MTLIDIETFFILAIQILPDVLIFIFHQFWFWLLVVAIFILVFLEGFLSLKTEDEEAYYEIIEQFHTYTNKIKKIFHKLTKKQK